MPFEPIWLKKLVVDCDISQGEIADALDVSRSAINSCLNRGYIPSETPQFKGKMEAFLQSCPKRDNVFEWLLKNGRKLTDIWLPLGDDLRMRQLSGHIGRTQAGIQRSKLVMGDPTIIEGGANMAEALHPGAMKQFRLFRNPFQNEIRSEKDIYLSEEHRFMEAIMEDAALHCGFVAVIGEVQAGKSIMRKKLVETLIKDSKNSVIYPRSSKVNDSRGSEKDKQKSRINANNLCDAIIKDISSEVPKNKVEDKVRQVEKLLTDRVRNGHRHVIIIEEAQNLTKVAFKYLKQIYEFEDGFKKLLSIILIGQPELYEYFDERLHPDLREVTQRAQVAEIQGLGDNMPAYLKFKFERIGAKIDDIFTPDAIEALSRRLASNDGQGRTISIAYPGLVNLYAVKAINKAYALKEAMVTAEVVEAI